MPLEDRWSCPPAHRVGGRGGTPPLCLEERRSARSTAADEGDLVSELAPADPVELSTSNASILSENRAAAALLRRGERVR